MSFFLRPILALVVTVFCVHTTFAQEIPNRPPPGLKFPHVRLIIGNEKVR